MTKNYTFATLDPRNIPAATEANEKVFMRDCGICDHSSGQLDGLSCRYCQGTGKVANDVMGIEVTVAVLAKRCNLGNIDPQHGNHAETYDNGSGYMEGSESSTNPNEAAIEFAARQPYHPTAWVASMIPPKGSTLATLRADLDSVGTMAVLSILARGESLESAKERIALVAASDKFARGGYAGPKSLPTVENPWPEESASAESSRQLAAIAAAVMDFKVSLADRVATMEKWLLTGEEPKQYRDSVEKERQDMVKALSTGQIKIKAASARRTMGRILGLSSVSTLMPEAFNTHVEVLKKAFDIAMIESTHRAATMVGYAIAPVVIALNPSFKFGAGEPHIKFTICQFTGGFVDLKAVTAELNELESGWGGSPTIIGSPQGVSSKLTLDEVTEVVAKHLLK